jgi:hypothetical protein
MHGMMKEHDGPEVGVDDVHSPVRNLDHDVRRCQLGYEEVRHEVNDNDTAVLHKIDHFRRGRQRHRAQARGESSEGQPRARADSQGE